MDDSDELESALFGSRTNPQSSNEVKKKVTFEEFDHNDPLQDLNLSDEFDDSSSHQELSLNIQKDNKLESLFGIKSDSKVETKDPEPENTLVLNDTKEIPKVKSPELSKKPLTPETSQSKEAVSNEGPVLVPPPTKPEIIGQKNRSMMALLDEDDDDDFGLPGTFKTPPALSQSKKSSLMEDLFGSRPKSSPALAEMNKKKDAVNADLGVTRSNPGESSTAFFGDASNKPAASNGFSLSASREPRRGRRAIPALHNNDPLGLLSAPSKLQANNTPKIEEKPIQSNTTHEDKSKASEMNDLPEWLGGPKIAKEERQENEKITRSETMSTEKSAETFDKTLSSTVLQMPTPEIDAEQKNLTSKLLGMEFDQQTAIINMQQQEHELRTAAALSQQSEKLNYLLETQKYKLTEQEKQFNMLVAKQMERQAMLEAQMKAQQSRIDNYIQTLAAQPTSVPLMHMPMDKEYADEKTESESLVQKLQIEKVYLENTLDSLREKHEKEICILEDSYKKQITFLEESMVQMEKRMQDDVECMESDYKLKIKKLREEIEENEKLYRTEKESMREENQRLVQEIRERHSKSLEILQKEHTETLQRITNSKEIERHAVEIMRVEGTNVENVLNKSQVIIEGLQNLEKKFDSRDKSFIESQDKHLNMQQKNIEYLKELLEKQKDEFAEEKQKLTMTIFKLESNTSELIKEFHKQNSNFKESEEILKSREQAFLREHEIFVEQTNWERERLQAMRETWSKEEDRQLEWLAQERQALATERGKLQIFNRLKIGVDESSKFELEATIKAAQDAAASANQERLKWQEKMNELNIQENALRTRESDLTQKAKELEDFTRAAIAKREEGLKALKEAQFIEERYKEKLNKMQMQEEILMQKESKLAAENLELARQRLTLRVNQMERPEKDISVAINNKTNQEDDYSSRFEILPSTQYSTYFKDIVDPHLVMLKWDLDNKLDGSSDAAITTN